MYFNSPALGFNRLPGWFWKSMDFDLLDPIIPKVHPLNNTKETQQKYGQLLELEREEIRVLTFNIFMRPPAVKNNIDDYKEERFEEFIKLFHEYDIICNQEVFSGLNTRKERLVSYATKAGFFDAVTSSKPGFWDHYMIDGGLVILSRFPIVYSAEHTYSRYANDDSMSKKGILYAKVKIGDCHLHVFNTHMQANYFHSSFYTYVKSIQYKTYQVKELVEFIDYHTQNLGPGDEIVVLGDFNISSRDANSYKREKIRRLSEIYPEFAYMLEDEFDFLKEYEIMMLILANNGKFRVHNLKQHIQEDGVDPVTFADIGLDEEGKEAPVDVHLTHKSDLMSAQSIDYIFKFERIDGATVDEEAQRASKKQMTKKDPVDDLTKAGERLEIDPSTMKVEKFEIQGKIFTHLSDHYGLSVGVRMHN